MPFTPSTFAVPPYDLLQRIGPMGEEDPTGVYERTGREHRELIESALPEDWTWEGKRVLDFGCGVGRILRQFAPEAEAGEFWGCDIDAASIEWLQANLSPPFHFFQSDEAAGLPQEDGRFDLIYALSVYTHLTDNWAGWLLEHHRVLDDGGLLFATFLGPGMIESLIGESWDEDRIGMNVLLHGNPWEVGGPVAFNSPWWIRAHWGRAFEILELQVEIGPEAMVNHGYVLMRKKPANLTEEDLLAIEPGEPREISALRHQIEQLRDETLRLRPEAEAHQGAVERERQLLSQQEDLARTLSELQGSTSWRITAPLRTAMERLRPRGG
jgi:SAM-dependent methyltransferase